MPRLIHGEFGTGWLPSRPDWRDKPLALGRFGSTLVPAHRDFRSDMPPVYYQGRTNSCCGNGTAGAIHYLRKREKLPDFVPSRMFIYWNGRDADGMAGWDGGSYVRSCLKSVAKLGACPEADWAFDQNHINTKPADACYTAAETDLVTGYASVPQDLDAIRAVLATDMPIVFGFSIYASFESSGVAKSGLVPMPRPIDIQIGGHCVMLCGYSDKSKVVIFRNSYGKDWGDSGYGYMPYDYLLHPGLCSDFWQVDVVSQ